MFALSDSMRNPFASAVQRSYMFILALALLPGIATAQKRAASTTDTQQMIAVQVALDRAGFSPGEIDGRAGSKTKLALSQFQKSAGLPATGAVNEETIAALGVPAEPVVTYTIAPEDVAGPFIGSMPADMMESAKLPALGYTSALEALAEKFHASPALLQTLNPGVAWSAGDAIRVPAVEPFEPPTADNATPGAKPAATSNPVAGANPAARGTAETKPARASQSLEVLISGESKSLLVRDADGKVLMYAPITIGSSKDPLPVGDWKVTGVSWNPTFNYNPDLFWDADPTHAKAKIPPGPNNPVGVVWVDINKEHFGLHGTPEPATIGRTESHGCIRLTNWDATKLGRLVAPGTKVTIR
jgi:lipoprotein-anchoring transpeptidase ErfK/SrfK